MALQHWTWEKDDSGIVTLAIAVDGKSVNVLTKAVFAEIGKPETSDNAYQKWFDMDIEGQLL